MTMQNEVMVRGEAQAPAELSVKDVVYQISKIQGLMKEVMKDGEHYGVIPGTGKKPSLLKPGAEKINFIFRLEPEYQISRHELPNGHREFEVVCTLRQIGSGAKVGEGVGSCSTMESKYRYRNVADYEILDQKIPTDAKERKGEYRKQGFGMKQIDGAWCWVKYTNTEKADNPDIADVYNTVLKMAKKRAYVDATLTATAASDFFTQDVEDFAQEPTQPRPATQPAPVQAPAPKVEEPVKRAEGQNTTFQASATRRQPAPAPMGGTMFDDRPIRD
jgi:hypothetical protein